MPLFKRAGFGLPVSPRRTLAFARPIRLRRIGARLRLARICLRCAIHGFAGQIRRLGDTGSPNPPSTGKGRRRGSRRTLPERRPLRQERGDFCRSPVAGVPNETIALGDGASCRRLRMRVVITCPAIWRGDTGSPKPARIEKRQAEACPTSGTGRPRAGFGALSPRIKQSPITAARGSGRARWCSGRGPCARGQPTGSPGRPRSRAAGRRRS